MIDQSSLAAAIASRASFADAMFEEARAASADVEGVTRPAWSAADMAAARILEREAKTLGLETEWDAAGNLYMTLPGRDRAAKAVMSGSHVDSVPRGGNYDGFAGSVASLVVLAACRDLGLTPPVDLRAIALHGEESVWYGIAYVGSRLAVGALPSAELDRLVRADSGRTLAEHIRECGFDPDALRAGPPPVTPANTRAFLELHIEQGPVLIDRDVPVAVATAIRGNVRFPYARCLGAYDHSAACPREYRQDTVLATVELVSRLERFWHEQEAAGAPDTVFTVGKFFTDPAEHAMTKVPGRTDFTLNFGATSTEFQDAARAEIHRLAEEIAISRGVAFELGECVGSDPTPLDPALRGHLLDAAAHLGIGAHEMATVGHDASIFARAGIPAAMVLVRNRNGSHNPHETMELADFIQGVKVLGGAMLAAAANR